MAQPQKISEILAQVIARHGYARQSAAAVEAEVWARIAGRWSGQTRVGELKRGVLEIFAASNVAIMELGFEKSRLLAELAAALPQAKLKDLRFKVEPRK
ncbi:MAG: DciA family protein [Pirellulales bacterium]|nr:DciA family protein [Pirellulales bacterium]